MRKVVTEIPEWLKALPKNSMLSAKEFAKALGVSQATFSRRDLAGEIPAAAKTHLEMARESGRFYVSSTKLSATNARFWSAAQVRNYMRQQLRNAKSKGQQNGKQAN